jgi:NTE family protein
MPRCVAHGNNDIMTSVSRPNPVTEARAARAIIGVPVRLFRRSITVNLALQGGGAHGAFTWGVLDRLLEEETVKIGWVSATSAGAVNAAALAAGLAAGGRQAARAKLSEVWQAIHKVGVPDFLKLNPFLYGLSRSSSMAQVASLWSPYEFNPLGFDPLRRLLTETIDFSLVQKGPIELLVAATEVATGRARLFRREGVTVDAVLASACLPTLHHAVRIDGVAYWDGGFSANPDIVTLAMESPIADTLIVQINPLVRQNLPTGSREISGQVNRLTFNAPLLRDVEIIETVRETLRGPAWWGRKARLKRLARHRYHLIEAGRYTGALSDDSKMKADLELITHLFGAGRSEADKWLDLHRGAVGLRETANLKQRFLAHEAPVAPADGPVTATSARGFSEPEPQRTRDAS